MIYETSFVRYFVEEPKTLTLVKSTSYTCRYISFRTQKILQHRNICDSSDSPFHTLHFIAAPKNTESDTEDGSDMHISSIAKHAEKSDL